ncbi:complexed with cef1p [Rhizina undulata]
MTTAHRPTFDPARGKEAPKGPAYHQRLVPAHTQLKVRQPGQGGAADPKDVRDLRAELLKAEAAHFAKVKGTQAPTEEATEESARATSKRSIEGAGEDGEETDSLEAKRRRILEESMDIDADSDGGNNSDSSEEESDDEEEDETAELLRELAKIKKERAEQREKEEREKAAQETADKEFDIARGNPLLNRSSADFNVKRRWDDDVIFKNQARGTEDKKKKEFVNDLLRSDFHKRFMNKYVR